MVLNNNTVCCGGRNIGGDFDNDRDDFRRNVRLDCFCRCDPRTNNCFCRCERERDRDRDRDRDSECFCRCDNRFNNCFCRCDRDRDRFDRV